MERKKIKNIFSIRFPKLTILLWICITLLSIAWYPMTGIFSPADIHNIIPLWFIVFALTLAFILGLTTSESVLPKLNIIVLILSFLASVSFSLLIPFPYNISSVFFIICFASEILKNLSIFTNRMGILKRISFSSLLCGTILLLQTAIFPIYSLLASRFHSIEISAPFINLIINSFGIPAANNNGHIYIQYADKVFAFIPSWELLGLYPLSNLFIGGCTLLYLFSASKSKYLILFTIVILNMLLHFIFVSFAFIEIQNATVFWRLDLLVIFLTPLPFIFNKVIPLGFSDITTEIINNKNFDIISYKSVKKKSFAYIIVLSVLIISITGFFGFADPGMKKEGKILIDESHSDWEWTAKKFDTDWYGEQSTYNYYCMAQYLNYFFKVDIKREKITDSLLSNFDILLIKTPTEPYTGSEILSIKKFVANGGGLLLVGDHTNVFGITTNLNPIASQFGMNFRYDGQYDLSGELSLFKKPLVMPHPVIQYMPDFMFATGCMLDVPLIADNAMIGYGIKSVYADYSRTNFFPKDAGNTENLEFGQFVQAAGIPYGKGRVFLFSDSTVWSNFYMFIPGKPELILGIIDWLNKRNSIFEYLRLTFLLLSLVSFIIALLLSRIVEKKTLIFLTILTGLLTAPISIVLFESLNHSSYPVLKAHTKFKTVAFETDHSDIDLPVQHMTEYASKSFHTFYVWLQRINMIPYVFPYYSNALSGSDVLVIINPVKPFSSEEIKKTKDFVNRGGKLLLIDYPIQEENLQEYYKGIPGKNLYQASPPNNNSNKIDFTLSNHFLLSLGVPIKFKNNSNTPINIFRSTEDSLKLDTYSAGRLEGGNNLLFCSAKLFTPPDFLNKYSNEFYTGKKPVFQRNEKNSGSGEPISGKKRNNKQDYKAKKNYVQSEEISSDGTSLVEPIMSEYSIGKGKIVVIAASSLFSDKEMGYNTVIPNENQKRIYELEYWIFQDVLGLK